MKSIVQTLVICLALSVSNAAWGMGGESENHKKVRLTEVSVITLSNGKMTKGRRSSAVSQLECISGGTAPCSAFTPRVVQCHNRGSDGYDVQWECTTDMDSAVKFGEIDVSCEGFDYPDDPYILHGSCGLRFSLDYTKEGQNQQGRDSYYGGGNQYSAYTKQPGGTKSIIADLLVYVAMGVMVYALYKTCINPGRHQDQGAYSTTNDDHPGAGGGAGGGGGGGYGWFGGGTNNQYGGTPRYQDDASCHNRRNNAQGGGGGGFWTGAATGGLLGYMFGGNRGLGGGNGGYGYGQRNRGGWFGNGGGYGGGFSGGSGGFSGGSGGSRSASGFGGTSRR